MIIDEPALKLFGSIGIIISGVIILFSIGMLIKKLYNGESPIFNPAGTHVLAWLCSIPDAPDREYDSVVYATNPGLNIAGITTTRWDIFYLFRWVFGLAALVYVSYCIQDMMTYPTSHPCMQHEAYIRELFIAFIFFLMILFFMNTLSAYQLTSLLTGIMRYFVPVTALALSGTLIYYSNHLSKLSPMKLVE
jgi:hypothetical protein